MEIRSKQLDHASDNSRNTSRLKRLFHGGKSCLNRHAESILQSILISYTSSIWHTFNREVVVGGGTMIIFMLVRKQRRAVIQMMEPLSGAAAAMHYLCLHLNLSSSSLS